MKKHDHQTSGYLSNRRRNEYQNLGRLGRISLCVNSSLTVWKQALLYFGLNILLCTAAVSGVLTGRVTDAESGRGIEAATVEVDLDPVGGTADFSTTTDLFGFYRMEDVTEGSGFTLKGSRAGYVAEELSELAGLGAGESRMLSMVLDRSVIGSDVFDIWFDISGVQSGVKLESVPVRVIRFTSADGSDTPQVSNGCTDENGFLALRGFTSGYFRFELNIADGDCPFVGNYEQYFTLGKDVDLAFLDKEHAVQLKLKHAGQDLGFLVTGFDPLTGMLGSLENAVVELTGVQPGDSSRVLVPTRSSVTGVDGRVTFTDLSPIHWKVVVKKAGYEYFEDVISPGIGNEFPAADIPLAVIFKPRSTRGTIRSINTELSRMMSNG